MQRKTLWRNIRGEVLFFLMIFSVMLVFRTGAYGMYHIPSESMLPTLAVGDRIAVSKFAYGYSRHSIPFSLAPDLPTTDGRIFSRLPERGDVVVFKHPINRKTLIKRVVGLPGDEIKVKQGRLYINGEEVERVEEDVYRYREHRGDIAMVARYEEDLPEGAAHEILERGDREYGDTFGPVTVPPNNLFVMGDNRDNSMDSRFPDPGVGFLPMDHVIGRADIVLFSINTSHEEAGLKRHKGKLLAPL